MASRVEPPCDANGKRFLLEAGERLDPVRERYTIANRLIYRAVVDRLFADHAVRADLDDLRAQACAAMTWNTTAATDVLVAAVVEFHGVDTDAAALMVATHLAKAAQTAGEGLSKMKGPTARMAATAARQARVKAMRRHRR